MALKSGKYTLGPGDGKLTVKTGKAGAAAKAGHNLVIEVSTWSATIEAGEDPADVSLALTADSRSLKVLDGGGGVKELSDGDMQDITATINKDVLKGGAIEFRSRQANPTPDGRLHVQGDLNLLGTTRPIDFNLSVDDGGHLTGEATVKQSDWGMKPYSALFGTLKVSDEVQVGIDAQLP